MAVYGYFEMPLMTEAMAGFGYYSPYAHPKGREK